MTIEAMAEQVAKGAGFIAALDQSGGSTPGALKDYGIAESEYSGDAEMYRLMHEMRVRVMSAPAFTGDKVLGSILFERTMDGEAGGKPVPSFLWEDRKVVPFLKVDKGKESEKDGVELMKPIPGLDELLARAVKLGVYGTKMRSVVLKASQTGIAAIVAQQFEVGQQILKHGLIPIIEPEVSVKSPEKAEAEEVLLKEIEAHLDRLPDGQQVMLKLTIPTKPDLYKGLTEHKKVQRLVALSGGYSQSDACAKLAHNHGMIASFSRALLEGLTKQQSDAEFDAKIAGSIDKIYTASTVKS